MPSEAIPPYSVVTTYLRAGQAVPLARRLPDACDPLALFERLLDRPYPFLLDSARRRPGSGRYSFFGADPTVVVRAKGPDLVPALARLRALVAAPPTVSVEGLPPFVGGLVGLLGYDMARAFERLPAQAVDDLGLPDLLLGLYETVVAFDHAEDAAWVITRVRPGDEPRGAYDEAVARLEAWSRRLTTGAVPTPGLVAGAECIAEMGPSAFAAMVRQAKHWIAAGEIYQANLSQRFHAPLAASPWTLYRRLRAVNPSPFAGYFDAGDLQLICGSPERLIRRDGAFVETRPIAGTRPRTGEAARDQEMQAELLLHPKERAEHLMLVDLERNDLGRVCAYGSVEVNELMTVEAYSHVFHIVSNVRGRLAPDHDWVDVLAAMFPGGTITGCPKLRAIEVIDALEPVRRQFYTGSLGYVSFTGAMDWNLIIRSALVTGGRVYVQTGAGIVADSDPAREYDETLHKARALFVALQEAPPVPAEVSDAVVVG